MFSKKEYEEKTDLELLWAHYEGTEDEKAMINVVLFERYQPMIMKHANQFYREFSRYKMFDFSDSYQEMWIGFHNALRDNNPYKIKKDDYKFSTILYFSLKKRARYVRRRKFKILSNEYTYGDYEDTFESMDEDSTKSKETPMVMRISIPEQVEKDNFNEKFNAYWKSLPEIEQKIIDALITKEKLTDVAKENNISYSKVTRMVKSLRDKIREEFAEECSHFMMGVKA